MYYNYTKHKTFTFDDLHNLMWQTSIMFSTFSYFKQYVMKETVYIGWRECNIAGIGNLQNIILYCYLDCEVCKVPLNCIFLYRHAWWPRYIFTYFLASSVWRWPRSIFFIVLAWVAQVGAGPGLLFVACLLEVAQVRRGPADAENCVVHREGTNDLIETYSP